MTAQFRGQGRGEGQGRVLTLYIMKGVTSSPTRAGAKAPFSHVTHGDAMTTPISVASFRHSRFCAAAVRKRAEVCTEPWNCACTRNLPSLLADSVPVSQRQQLNRLS